MSCKDGLANGSASLLRRFSFASASLLVRFWFAAASNGKGPAAVSFSHPGGTASRGATEDRLVELTAYRMDQWIQDNVSHGSFLCGA
jgi:hypothetical protein